jgi:transcription antitermination protein NusB
MGARRKGREYALQALYLMDVVHFPAEKAVNTILSGTGAEKPIADFARQLTRSAADHLEFIDQLIIKIAQNWEMGRMAALDRNILRLGAYELLFELDTPVSVIIDEAVEIAKTFSTDESGKFVNGILDKIKHERKIAQKS